MKNIRNACKQITIICLVFILLVLQCAAGFAQAAGYPNFKIDVKYVAEGSSLVPGGNLKLNLILSRMNGDLDGPFEYLLKIRTDYIGEDGVDFESQLEDETDEPYFMMEYRGAELEDGTPAVTGSAIDEIEYQIYSIKYNTNVSNHNIVAATMSVAISLSDDPDIIWLENPILIEAGAEIIIPPFDISEADVELELKKEFSKQFRLNGVDVYENISKAGFKRLNKGDLVEFKFTLENKGNVPYIIKAGNLIEILYNGYTFYDVNDSANNYQIADLIAANEIQTTHKLISWVKGSSVSTSTNYTYEKEITVDAGTTHTYYLYAKVAVSDRDPEKLKNTIYIHTKNDPRNDGRVDPNYPYCTVYPPKVLEFAYDMAVSTHIVGLYPDGYNSARQKVSSVRDNTEFNDLKDLITDIDSVGEPAVTYNDDLNKEGLLPIVFENGKDIFKIRTYYYNQGYNDVSNVDIALYLPRSLEIIGCSHPIFFKKEDNRYSWKPVVYNVIAGGANYPSPYRDGLESDTRGYFDVLVRRRNAGDEQNQYWNRFIGAEIARIMDEKGSKVVEDQDSTNDFDPYDEWNSNIYKVKEKDNVIDENAKKNPLENDEDDFDFARFSIEKEEDNTTQLRKSVNMAKPKVLYPYSKWYGYKYDVEYTPLPYNNVITDPYTYIGYEVRVNVGGNDILTMVEVEDRLPKGLNFLRSTEGKPVFEIEVVEGTGYYEGKRFPDERYEGKYSSKKSYTSYINGDVEAMSQEHGITIDFDFNANSFIVKADELNHKEINIYFLTGIDKKNVNYGKSYNNKAVLRGNGVYVEVPSDDVSWKSASAVAYVDLFYKVNQEWVKDKQEHYQTIRMNNGKFQVDYRIALNSKSSGEGFAKDQITIIDSLGEKASAISNITFSGTDARGNAISGVDKLFTTKKTNNYITITNSRDIAANASVYYFDFSVTYGNMKAGEVVYNQIFNEKLYTLTPLKLELEKQDPYGELLDGTVFEVYHGDGTTAALDMDGNPIVIMPNTDRDTAFYFPKDYLVLTESDIILKEVTAGAGYAPRDYRLKVVKDMNGNIMTKTNGTDLYISKVIKYDVILLKAALSDKLKE